MSAWLILKQAAVKWGSSPIPAIMFLAGVVSIGGSVWRSEPTERIAIIMLGGSLSLLAMEVWVCWDKITRQGEQAAQVSRARLRKRHVLITPSGGVRSPGVLTVAQGCAAKRLQRQRFIARHMIKRRPLV